MIRDRRGEGGKGLHNYGDVSPYACGTLHIVCISLDFPEVMFETLLKHKKVGIQRMKHCALLFRAGNRKTKTRKLCSAYMHL